MQGKTRQIGQFQREKENFPDPELMWVTAREVERLREKELETATVRARARARATAMVREPEPEAWCQL